MKKLAIVLIFLLLSASLFAVQIGITLTDQHSIQAGVYQDIGLMRIYAYHETFLVPCPSISLLPEPDHYSAGVSYSIDVITINVHRTEIYKLTDDGIYSKESDGYTTFLFSIKD